MRSRTSILHVDLMCCRLPPLSSIFYWGSGFQVMCCLLTPAGGVEERVTCYTWRCRWTHLSAIYISHVFKDGAPVCQFWRAIGFFIVKLTPVSSLLVRTCGNSLLVWGLPAALLEERTRRAWLPCWLWSSLCALESLINTLFWTLLLLRFPCLGV